MICGGVDDCDALARVPGLRAECGGAFASLSRRCKRPESGKRTAHGSPAVGGSVRRSVRRLRRVRPRSGHREQLRGIGSPGRSSAVGARRHRRVQPCRCGCRGLGHHDDRRSFMRRTDPVVAAEGFYESVAVIHAVQADRAVIRTLSIEAIDHKAARASSGRGAHAKHTFAGCASSHAAAGSACRDSSISSARAITVSALLSSDRWMSYSTCRRC